MKKKFQLRWVSGEEARLHTGGEWQLHFASSSIKEYANNRLDFRWLTPILGKGELFYVFKVANAGLPVVLSSLLSAGIPKEELEIKVPVGKPTF